MTQEVNEMKSLLGAGLVKIDKTATTTGAKVDQIETMESEKIQLILFCQM